MSLQPEPAESEEPAVCPSSTAFTSSYLDLVKECESNRLRPLLQRISQEAIDYHLSIRDANFVWGGQARPAKTEKKLTNRKLRDIPRVGAEMFVHYKRRRQKYLKKKARSASTEMAGDFSSFSSENSEAFSDEENYLDDYNTSSRDSRKRKRKKLSYEDDLEWNPNSKKTSHFSRESSSRSRKALRNLRVNTRRKRIESNSSSSSDDFFDYFLEEDFLVKDDAHSEVVAPQLTPSNSNATGNVNDLNSLPQLPMKKKPTVKKAIAKELEEQVSTFYDSDVLSKIMQEMEDFSMKNGRKIVKSNGSEERSNSDSNALGNGSGMIPKGRRNIFKNIKITDKHLTPSLNTVQDVVMNIVNTVCKCETESQKKKCKWCETPFSSGNPKDTLCAICKDVVKLSSQKSPSNKRLKVKKSKTTKQDAKVSKIKKVVMKNLPKHEQQRLMYGDRADKSSVEKGYNHCKGFSTLKDMQSSGTSTFKGEASADTSVANTFENNEGPIKVKKKKKSKTIKKILEPSKEPKKKKPKASKNVSEIINQVNSNLSKTRVINKTDASGQKKVSVTNVDKGLFLMTFPDPQLGLDEIPVNSSGFKQSLAAEKLKEMSSVNAQINNLKNSATDSTENKISLPFHNKPKQPAANSVQYGSYLLPPVPTVVVANYAATDAKNGDYYLSSLYYQNEMTQAKNNVQANNIQNGIVPSNSIILPSMPSIEQLSSIPVSSAKGLPPPYPFVSQSVVNPNYNIIGGNVSVVNQSVAPTSNICVSPYSSEQSRVVNISRNLPLPSMSAPFQASQYIQDSNLARLLTNSQLQIDPVPPDNMEMSYNTLENEEFVATLSLEKSKDPDESLGIRDNMDSFGLLGGAGNINLDSDPMSDSASVSLSEVAGENQDNNERDLANESGETENQNNDTLNQQGDNAAASGHLSSENLSSEDLLNCSYSEMDAIGILGVVDLEKNPKHYLNCLIKNNQRTGEELKNSRPFSPEKEEECKRLSDSLNTLQIAYKLLIKYGSFTKLSDMFLRKERLLQIKKEKCLEEGTLSSCQFAQSQTSQPASNQSLGMPCSETEQSRSKKETPTPVQIKMENAGLCSLNSQSSSTVNHIEKIQTQIESIQNTAPVVTPEMGMLHQFPVPGLSSVLTNSNMAMSVTPRSEMLTESRETPSRGSGPRTPARPESALSQPEESVLTPLQIKKERIEAANSPLSQCAYSQNTPSPRVNITSPNLSQISRPLNNPVPPSNNPPQNRQVMNVISTQRLAAPNVSVNNNPPQIQSIMQLQNQTGPPNVTVPFSSNSNFSKVLLNIASKQPPNPNVSPNVIANNRNANVLINKNGQIFNVQQVFVPGTSGVQQRYNVQAVTSATNQFLYKQTQMTVANPMGGGGTVLMNTVRSPNTYSLPSNATNTHMMAPHQPSRICNTGQFQPNMQQIPNASSPATSSFLMQNNNATKDDTLPEMYCAVCNRLATLRCKQCAKVAYCDTNCAKKYWHSRHKMECKAMTGS